MSHLNVTTGDIAIRKYHKNDTIMFQSCSSIVFLPRPSHHAFNNLIRLAEQFSSLSPL